MKKIFVIAIMLLSCSFTSASPLSLSLTNNEACDELPRFEQNLTIAMRYWQATHNPITEKELITACNLYLSDELQDLCHTKISIESSCRRFLYLVN